MQATNCLFDLTQATELKEQDFTELLVFEKELRIVNVPTCYKSCLLYQKV